jgi:antitoxin VapB
MGRRQMLWHYTMGRIVKLFRQGHNQAVRIPREFELPGDAAIMRKEGDRLIVEPMPRTSLLELLAGWRPLDETLAEIPNLPAEPVEIRLVTYNNNTSSPHNS